MDSGWFVLASASISGSFCCCIVLRYLLNPYAAIRLIVSNQEFSSLADSLKETEGSLLSLVLIRLRKLPYALSNGALASVPEMSSLTFFLASLLTSPKLMINICFGTKWRALAEVKS